MKMVVILCFLLAMSTFVCSLAASLAAYESCIFVTARVLDFFLMAWYVGDTLPPFFVWAWRASLAFFALTLRLGQKSACALRPGFPVSRFSAQVGQSSSVSGAHAGPALSLSLAS
jgi:hypothetical protein